MKLKRLLVFAAAISPLFWYFCVLDPSMNVGAQETGTDAQATQTATDATQDIQKSTAAFGTAGQHHPSSGKFKNIQEALRAVENASTKQDESDALDDLKNQKVETREDVLALHETIKSMEGRAAKGSPLEEVQVSLRKLYVPFQQLRDPKHHAVVAELIEKESQSDTDLSRFNPWRGAARDNALNLRISRLFLLIKVAGEGRNRTALPILREIAKRDDMIGHEAVSALSKIGDPGDLEQLIARIKENPRMTADLSGFGPALIDRIMRDVDDPAVDERTKAALIGRLLQGMGPASVQKLRPLVNHKNPMVVEKAALALGESLGPSDESIAIEMLHNSDAYVRICGLGALDEKMWSMKYVPILIELLKNDASTGVRSEAAHILGQRRIVDAVPALKEALKIRSGELREAAQGALDEIDGTYDRRLQESINRTLKSHQK